MNTTEYYLRQLDYYRRMLINNLRDLGIECDDNETYNTLIPKIYSLTSSGGVILYDYSLYGYNGSVDEVLECVNNITPVGQPTSMLEKFKNCVNLTYLPLYKWDTSKVTSIKNMIEGVTGPINIDAHGCNFSSITSAGDIAPANTHNLTDLDLTNATLTLAAFKSFTSYQENLLSIKGFDTINFALGPIENTLSLTNLFNYTGLDMDITHLMNQLENRNIIFGSQTFQQLVNMSYPIIYPKCYTNINNIKDFGCNFTYKVKHFDASLIEITNIDTETTTTCRWYFNGFARDVDDMSDAVFKLPEGWKKLRFSTFSCTYEGKAFNLLDLTGLKLTAFTAITPNWLKVLDYSIFDIQTPPTATTTVLSNSSYNDFPYLEYFKYNLGGTINMNNLVTNGMYFSNCPKIRHFEITDTNIKTIYGLFYAQSSDYKIYGDVVLDYLSFERCVFQGTTGDRMIYCANYFKHIKEFCLKDCQFPNAVDMSGYVLYYASKCKKLNMEGVDWGHVNKMSATTFPYYNAITEYTLEEFIPPSNIGQAFTQASNNYSYYTIHYEKMPGITKSSVLDLFNKVYDLNMTYDVANGGTLYTQQIILHENLLSQLSPEEIAIATNKGWTVS